MNISMSAPDPGDNNPERKTPEEIYAQLLKDLKPQLDSLPSEVRIPTLPPNADAATEVQEYIRNKMKLPVATDVPNWMLIGNESIERAKIREGRIGEMKGKRAFAFLYPYGKSLKTVCIYSRDGINVRMIAKAVMWGQVSEIPASLAQSEILDITQFFLMNCLNPKQLLDAPLLEKAKAEYMEKFEAENQRLRSRLAQAEQATVTPAAKESNSGNTEDLKEEIIKEQNRAEGWKLFGMLAGGIAAMELIPTVEVLFR